MIENSDQLINIALVGHSGSGKTSISEVILFRAGLLNRIGRVEDGNTVMDFEPEEVKRNSSVSTSFYQFRLEKNIINLLDTPGDQNFISDTKICMQAADSVVVVIDSVDGIKMQTEYTWGIAKKYNQPSIIFINKLDNERSNFKKTLENIKNILSIKPLVLQIPVMDSGILRGVIDLISGESYIYDKNGNFKLSKMPENLVNEFNYQREKLIEDIAELDDSLIEKYLEGEEIPILDLQKVLKGGILSRHFFPILCGSAKENIGIDLLINFILEFLPSAVHGVPKKGVNLDNNKIIERKIMDNESFSGFVFKTITDPYAGKLSLFKIISGVLKDDSDFYNSSKSFKEKFNQLLVVLGKNQKNIDFAAAGSIVAVAKLKVTKTGDTLCNSSNKIIYKCSKPLPPLISFAVESKQKGDEDKVYISLNKLLEDDPSLKLDRNSETKEIILSGLGQIHIETAIEKLKRKFNLDVLLKVPKIPYRETIKKKVRAQGKYKKQSGGHGQFGDCWITIEPMPRGSGFEFIDAIVGGAIPKQYIPAVEKGIIDASQKGILTGFPCVDFKATCDFGSYHSVDSSEMAFKIAGSLAYKKACEQANPIILEPIMKISVTIPDEFTGDIMGDLNSRRGRVLGVKSSTKNQIINAEVPLSEVQLYAIDLISITAGRGIFTMEFLKYDEVPSSLYDRTLKKIKEYLNND